MSEQKPVLKISWWSFCILASIVVVSGLLVTLFYQEDYIDSLDIEKLNPSQYHSFKFEKEFIVPVPSSISTMAILPGSTVYQIDSLYVGYMYWTENTPHELQRYTAGFTGSGYRIFVFNHVGQDFIQFLESTESNAHHLYPMTINWRHK